jgi:hypothetical protein
MSEDLNQPQRGYTTKDVEAVNAEERAAVAPRPRRRRWGLILLGIFVLLPAIVFTLWAGITLHWTYSAGNRVGYVLKFSKKGWLCKTWEGELSMATVPGVAPEKWAFTVRDDGVARKIQTAQGQQVDLLYEQHKFVPSSCFGETEYFVTDVRPLGNTAPLTSPAPVPPTTTPAPTTTR